MISRHLDVSPPIHVFFPHPIKVWRKRFIEHENCAFGRALDPRRCSKRTDCQVPLHCHHNSEFFLPSITRSHFLGRRCIRSTHHSLCCLRNSQKSHEIRRQATFTTVLLRSGNGGLWRENIIYRSNFYPHALTGSVHFKFGCGKVALYPRLRSQDYDHPVSARYPLISFISRWILYAPHIPQG